MLVRVSRRMKNAGKVVRGASLYVFAKITETEQKMMQKAKALAKAAARAVRPVLWPRKSSESHSARVPSENLIFRSKSVEKPAPDVSAHDRAGIGFQMRDLLASLRGRQAPNTHLLLGGADRC